VRALQTSWESTSGTAVTPKIHMLRHCADFASTHGFLGRTSESQLESSHCAFKRLLKLHHFNNNAADAEGFRRCLADSALVSVQRVLIAPS
jgi:hypothetical protein